ncbi:MAG: energy transducer TonB [Gemmatimonadaceae bacterium]
MIRRLALTVLALSPITLAACIDKETTQKAIELVQEGPSPDSLPVMRNRELPFRYPPALYERKVQGDVMLRIFIDSMGFVVPESTSVAESSGYPALDSAAVSGAANLGFSPARANGRSIAISILLPVRFRHPRAPPLPGDSAPLAGPKPATRPRSP